MNEHSPTWDAGKEPPALIEEIEAMRAMFGTPTLSFDPTVREAPAGQGMADARIAIIDDQPLNIRTVKKYLTLLGYRQLFTTNDSTRAIELIEAERPHVVLLDILMPHVDGLQILERLRRMARFVHLPVVILTAVGDRETKLKALKLGATEFLQKPVDPVELESRLRNVLALKAYHDRLEDQAWELEVEVAIRSTELAKAHREVVQCLAIVGEYRDNETGNHTLRVGKYAEIIARTLRLNNEFVGRIRETAPLHDIGKIGIRDSILLKPGRLDACEFEEIKRHCDYGKGVCTSKSPSADSETDFQAHTKAGAAIASAGSSPILKMAATIAFTHHERWDGTGYPQGLRGEDIPIEGRITAVADVFDALTTERPYKPAFPLEKSLAIMDEMRGTHFDPEVLDAFFAGIDEIIDAYHEHRDEPEQPSPPADEPFVTPILAGE